MNVFPIIRTSAQLNIPAASLATAGIAQKVGEYALKYIPAFRQSGFFILGIQDIASGINNERLMEQQERVSQSFWKAIAGTSLLISGTLGLWSSVDYITKGYATTFNEQLFVTGNAFFLFSSLLRLKTCIDDYLSADNRQEEISAMMGVGANFCYIIAAANMLFAPPAAFIIILCSVGTATSFFQAIYDYAQS